MVLKNIIHPISIKKNYFCGENGVEEESIKLNKQINTFILFVNIFCVYNIHSYAQSPTDSSKNWQLSLYIEGYYTLETNDFSKGSRPPYLYSFHRRNELNLNLGVVQYTYDNSRIRGTVGVQMGTYASRNYGNEPNFLRLFNQANAGIRLSKSKELWLDAGVLESHIGFESTIGGDCWTASRSLLADNSPYFNTGIQLSYQSNNEQHEAALVLVNGWQRIAWVSGNSLPSIGHRYTYTPNTAWTINSSSQIGSDYSDADRRMRYFHNFYSKFEGDKNGFIIGLDIGLEQESKAAVRHYLWWAPIAVYQRIVNKQLKTAARLEYFYDQAGVLIPLQNEISFSNVGCSVNIDYSPLPQITMRLEWRSFVNRIDYFPIESGYTNQNHSIQGHLIVRY